MSGMETDLDTQLHLTRLFTWAVITFAKAFGLSVIVAGAIGAGAVAGEEPSLAWAAAFVGPLVFAGILYDSDAPLPLGIDEEADENSPV